MLSLQAFISETWHILLDASPFVLFGFLVAGLVKGLLSDEVVSRHLGKQGMLSVFKAALLGIPLPLCSCGVIPAAIGLRRQGASKGATSAFLISTPETGVDSIAVTYALLDPLMTLFRPFAAFVTAVIAGFFENLFPSSAPVVVDSENSESCGGGCCGAKKEERLSLWKRLLKGVDYAFGELLGDIGKWLLGGILVAGAISAFMPEQFIERHLSSGFGAMLLMLFAGIPLYVCASASTPIAAALMLKGLSPGAALVFLLAGPATNSATIAAIWSLMGKRSLLIYLLSISLGALSLGSLLDLLYGSLSPVVSVRYAAGETIEPSWFSVVAALLLIFLVARNAVVSLRKKGSCGCA